MKNKYFLLVFLLLTACRGPEVRETPVEEEAIKIAAVGDSITAEFIRGADYPAVLDEKLSEMYTVVNFGESNHAAQASSDFPYETTSSYEESLAFNPDILIMMLGTNDTKAHNWNGAERFKEEYSNLLENYLELKTVQRVILASPPTVFLDDVVEGSIDLTVIEPIRDVVREVAEEYEVEFIDMTEKTNNHPEWFFDGVHPTPEGAEEIAQIFYKQIID